LEHDAATEVAKRFPQHRGFIILQLRRDMIEERIGANHDKALLSARAAAAFIRERLQAVEASAEAVALRDKLSSG
jgi:hypothetical protein